VKNSVSGGSSIIRGCQLDQQTAGQKGIRSLHLRREASKSAAEEVCCMSQLLNFMAHMVLRLYLLIILSKQHVL
jgi:hypothetical protein